MPHIDFRQLLPDQDKETATPAETGIASPLSSDRVGDAAPKAQSTRRTGHLGPPGWVNIFFVALATLGGIGCAFYFFNGTEVFRATTTWSREFLYPQPPAVVANVDTSNRRAAAGRIANSTARLNDVAHNTAAPPNRSFGPPDLSNRATLGPANSALGNDSISPQTRNESLPSSQRNTPSTDTNSEAQTSSRTVSKSESPEETMAAARKTSNSAHKSASETTITIVWRTNKVTHKSRVTSKSAPIAMNDGFPVASNMGFEAAFGGGTIESLSGNPPPRAKSEHSTTRTGQKSGTGVQSTAGRSVTSRTIGGFGMSPGGFPGFGGRVGGFMGHGERGRGRRGR
jgi:hypothetical protein